MTSTYIDVCLEHLTRMALISKLELILYWFSFDGGNEHRSSFLNYCQALGFLRYVLLIILFNFYRVSVQILSPKGPKIGSLHPFDLAFNKKRYSELDGVYFIFIKRT